MKITTTTKTKESVVADLKAGDVFERTTGANIPWMVMDTLKLSDNTLVNAVSLDDGTPGYFYDKDPIVPLLDAELRTNE